MPIFPLGKERIAITLGDPAGIGPEVTLKALQCLKKNSPAKILLLGPAAFYHDLAEKLKLKILFKNLAAFSEWKDGLPFIPCYFEEALPKKILLGASNNLLTTRAVRSIELAVYLAMQNAIDAIVTPPINKAGLKKAGFSMPGHTEYLADLSRTKRYEMMLVGGGLRVALVTRHIPLKDVSRNISFKRVEETILLTDQELRRSFGFRRPRIVVCGLNPHAGEQGNLGMEEDLQIAPALRSARKKTNAEITGPLSPDTLFYDAVKGDYDAEVCMYHDQGLIPLKMISRGSGVNVTLGLPFVRTSPDHGTGYDIAPAFAADPGSMVEAIRLACLIFQNRRKYARAHSRS
ncbi:MAG: 4-hydroxythreonine-4-phosphate dehydrogenase PdxA [Candidatus Omnitrophica bacterium CG1_02_49_16]|nr:MAG: 4-hydroxythreonine-4-phosphate dehydrogenase PdxA [Candidatus Omnitrophica bacterium CG1_02_49_16]